MDELLQREALLVVDERLDRRQAVGAADDAEHLARGVQVAHAALKDRLAARDAVVEQQAQVQVRRVFAGDRVVQVLVHGEAVDDRLELREHRVVQLLEGVEFGERAGLHAAADVLELVDAVVQRDLERLERVDAVVRRADAAADEHVFAAAERHVLLGLLAGNAVDLLNRGDVRLVGIDDRERRALGVDLHRLAEDFLAHAAVVAQRELRHDLAEAAGGLHDDHGEAVRRFGTAAAEAADDHAAVVDLVDLLEVLVEREHDLDAVLLGDASGVDVGGVEPAEVVVHAAVVHQVGADRVDPHQLHALEERLRRVVLDREERAGQRGEASARRLALRGFAERKRLLAVARARAAQAFDPHLERGVERGRAVLFGRRVDLAVEAVEAERHQLFKVEVRAGDAAVAVAGARALVALRRHVAVALRKREVELARGGLLVPEHVHGRKLRLFLFGQLAFAFAHGEQEIELVEVVRVAAADLRRVAAHLRGEAGEVVLVAAGDAVVFIHRHEDVPQLEVEAFGLADVDVVAVRLVDAREFDRIAQLLQIAFKHKNHHSLFFVPVGEADCRFARRGKGTNRV